MKVIILQIDGGHVLAFEYTRKSMIALVGLLVEGNEINTILQEVPPTDLLDRSAAEIESWICEHGPVSRCGGNLVNFLEVQGLDQQKGMSFF